MNNKRYEEEYQEGHFLLWPSEKEDKITRNFYKDLSKLSQNIEIKKKKESFLKIIFLLILGKLNSSRS